MVSHLCLERMSELYMLLLREQQRTLYAMATRTAANFTSDLCLEYQQNYQVTEDKNRRSI